MGPDRVHGPSSATRKVDLHGKRPAHARKRVARLWLVDPTGSTLGVFELRVGQAVRIGTATDEDLIRIRFVPWMRSGRPVNLPL